jgi:hypothetical protein
VNIQKEFERRRWYTEIVGRPPVPTAYAQAHSADRPGGTFLRKGAYDTENLETIEHHFRWANGLKSAYEKTWDHERLRDM